MATRYWADACATAAWKSASSSARAGSTSHCATNAMSTVPTRRRRWLIQDAVMVALAVRKDHPALRYAPCGLRATNPRKPCGKIEDDVETPTIGGGRQLRPGAS